MAVRVGLTLTIAAALLLVEGCKMGLATTQTKVCSVTPIPFRSPRGHPQSLRVATPPSFCSPQPSVNKFPRLGTIKKALQSFQKMGLATAQTKVCFVTPIPFRSPRGHLQSLKVATPPSFYSPQPFVNKFPRLGTIKKALSRLSKDGIGYYAD